jgi:hypothetical protein
MARRRLDLRGPFRYRHAPAIRGTTARRRGIFMAFRNRRRSAIDRMRPPGGVSARIGSKRHVLTTSSAQMMGRLDHSRSEGLDHAGSGGVLVLGCRVPLCPPPQQLVARVGIPAAQCRLLRRLRATRRCAPSIGAPMGVEMSWRIPLSMRVPRNRSGVRALVRLYA